MKKNRMSRRALSLSTSLVLCAGWPLVLGSCSSGGGGPAPAAQSTETAKANLNNESSAGLIAAKEDLEAVLADPNQSQAHNLAHAMLGTVRIAVFLDDNEATAPLAGGTSLGQLLADLGIDLQGLSIFELFDDEEDNIPGPSITETSPGLDAIQLWLREDLRAVIAAAAADFEAVQPGWSQLVTGLLDLDPVELDYGDCQFLAAGLRAAEAGLLLQGIIDLRANIYELDRRANEWGRGTSAPYRLFSGDSPDNIVQGAMSTGSPAREGFLNEAELLQSANTFDTTPEAAALLDDARLALLHGLQNLRRGVEYEEDGNSADDFIYLSDRCGYDAIWFNDVEAALNMTDADVAAVHLDQPMCDETYDLPGFRLDPEIVFDSSTYSGRLFLPDYGGGDTVATAGSFDHFLSSDLNQLTQDLGDTSSLTGDRLLAFWNGLNAAWDELWVEEVLEPGAY